MEVKRVFLIVLDSFGCGALPDAAKFGDGDVNTLRSVTAVTGFSVPRMEKLGLYNIEGNGLPGARPAASPAGAYGRMAEQSLGKDTVTGHWEIAGVVSQQAMPTFPEGFPPELIAKLEEAFGVGVLCNKPYSGTEVIHDYGPEHVRTRKPIVYTSADSVLQIACHEEVYSRQELYELCEKARKICAGGTPWGVGRVIARPFIGDFPAYQRTSGRHDYALEPSGPTVLDAAAAAGQKVISVGKIRDIFAGKSITDHQAMDGNADGMNKAIACLKDKNWSGLCFVNLVDFDMQYGHRRDPEGYAKALEDFDGQLAEFLRDMTDADVLILTADHGCDPNGAGSDHTREYVPVLIYGASIRPGTNLGTRKTFADLGATVAQMLKLADRYQGKGDSFWAEIAVG